MDNKTSNLILSGKSRYQSNTRSSPTGIAVLLTSPLWLGAGWVAFSNLMINHALHLPPAINAELKSFESGAADRLAYYSERTSAGRPLVLIHSINAAASSYELRPIFESYALKRPVYALDLPGFGFSDRSDRVYSHQLYADAIREFLASIVGVPADVIALSLGCEFVALAAMAQPEQFHSLAFISPTGFTTRQLKRGSQSANENGIGPFLYRAFSYPLWGRAFYDLIATRKSIHYFLQQSFEGPVDGGLENYAYATSHQPGAHHAPLYFVSGQLFTRNILANYYERLPVPVLVLYDRDPFVSFGELPGLTTRRTNWRSLRVTPTKGLPQFEQLAKTTEALDQFWSESPS